MTRQLEPSQLSPSVLTAPWFLRSRTRLLATLTLVVGLPLGAFTAFVLVRARHDIEALAVRQNQVAARMGAEAVQAHFEGLERYVEAHARNPLLSAAISMRDETAVRERLRALVDGNSHVDRSFVTDVAGVELWDWPRDPSVIGKNFSYRDWYQGVSRTHGTYLSEVYLRAAAPQKDIVSVATPVQAADGQEIGYLVAQHTVQALVRRLASIKPAGEGSVLLVDSRGHLVAERDEPQGPPPDLSQHPLVRRVLAGEEVTRAEGTLGSDVESLMSCAQVAPIHWIVVAQQPVTSVMTPVRALQSGILTFATLCLLGTLSLGFVWLNVVRRHHVALIQLQQLKDQLTGMIIHDLRNPLATSMMSIELVRARSRDLESWLRVDLDRAARSSKRLLGLVNNLLDVMRLEEGAMALKLSSQDVAALVRSKVDEFRALAQADAHALESLTPDEPLVASVDPELLGRVLDNLIINALRHTRPGGRVDVTLAVVPERDRFVLTIADSGEGIPADALPHLFQKFQRVAGQEFARREDVGLGLVQCRMAVELHGGTIDVESELGRGSVFRIELPLSGRPGAVDTVPSTRRAVAARAPAPRSLGAAPLGRSG